MIKKSFHTVILRPIVRMANTPAILVLGVVLTLLVGALGFVAIEGSSFLDGLYWASTTLTSVGYGDLSPATNTGKVMTIAFQLWAIFVLLPCAITNIVESVKVDPNAFSHDEQEFLIKYAIADARAKNYDLGPEPADY